MNNTTDLLEVKALVKQSLSKITGIVDHLSDEEVDILLESLRFAVYRWNKIDNILDAEYIR